MDYKVVVTRDAEEDFERFINYLLYEKKSFQAANNLLNDYDTTIESLRHVAGSLKLRNMGFWRNINEKIDYYRECCSFHRFNIGHDIHHYRLFKI